jgi:hypothetical protein
MSWNTDIPTKWVIIAAVILAIIAAAIGYKVAGRQLGISNDTEVHVRNVSPSDKNGTDQVCVQVVTRARNPQTHETKDFATPCDVPGSWEIIQ